MSRATALLLFVAIVVGCSGGGTSSPAGSSTAGDAGTTPQTPGDPSVLAGTFQIKLASSATSFIGKVYDGATPSEVVWEPKVTDGDCVLLVPRIPFCNSPCGGSSVCVEDEVCRAYPTSRSVGAVTLMGVKTTAGVATVSMNAIANNYQPPGGTTLAFPPFSEGDAIRLEASGDVYAAFAIEATGIAALEMPTDALPLAMGQPAKLTWTPSNAAISTVAVKLDVSHHGGSKGKIECETADDGELELSTSLVGALLDLGVAGYPTIITTRKTIGSTTIAPGRVELVLAAEVERAVSVDGLTSCTETSQCPEGKTCQSDLTCR